MDFDLAGVRFFNLTLIDSTMKQHSSFYIRRFLQQFKDQVFVSQIALISLNIVRLSSRLVYP